MAKKKSFFGKRSGGSAQLLQVNAMIAGAVIPRAAAMLNGIIPSAAGAYQQNLQRGLVSWAAAKWGSGMIRSVGQAGLTAENYLVGTQASAGLLGTQGATASTNAIAYY